ncbi:MAG: hypothetical protein FWC41_01105, partial [Firmicutes bacterium]|nr:hypothetical protein [Bacillota bacterium]
TFSYASSNDTLICEVLPIAKQVPRHPSATITTVAYNMLTKKNKTITQTLPVPLNAIENIHYVIIKHYVITKGQDYKYVFKNKEDNLELFEMFGVEKNTVQVEP